MSLRAWRYFFSEALINIRRHSLMSLATMTTVAVAVAIFGIFALLSINLENALLYEAKKLEAIRVYLKTDAGIKEAKEVERKIRQIKMVKSCKFVHKDEGLKQMQRRFGNHMPLKDLLGKNPLPHKFAVTAVDVRKVPECVKLLKELPHVESVIWVKEAVKKVVGVMEWRRKVWLWLSFLLGLAALGLTYSAIALTIYARRSETKIMQLVGATLWFIRMPFLLEGLTYGLAGSLIGAGLLWVGYEPLLKQAVGQELPLPLLPKEALGGAWFLWLVALGSGCGMLGSLLAARRLVRYV